MSNVPSLDKALNRPFDIAVASSLKRGIWESASPPRTYSTKVSQLASLPPQQKLGELWRLFSKRWNIFPTLWIVSLTTFFHSHPHYLHGPCTKSSSFIICLENVFFFVLTKILRMIHWWKVTLLVVHVTLKVAQVQKAGAWPNWVHHLKGGKK